MSAPAPLKRGRVRRFLAWLGTAACLLVLLAAAVCLHWEYISVAVTQRSQITLGSGALSIGRSSPSSLSYAGKRLTFGRTDTPGRRLMEDWSYHGSWPRIYDKPWQTPAISVPLWIIFLLLSVPTALLWYLDRRRIIRGHCEGCGYNLTGNTSGRCPECGLTLGSDRPHTSASSSAEPRQKRSPAPRLLRVLLPTFGIAFICFGAAQTTTVVRLWWQLADTLKIDSLFVSLIQPGASMAFGFACLATWRWTRIPSTTSAR